MLTVHENAISPELMLELRTVFDRIKNEIGFHDRYYLPFEDRYVKDTFRKFIINTAYLPILCEGDQALHMEREGFHLGMQGIITTMNSPEKMQPYIKEVVQKIYKIIFPLLNIVRLPIDLMFVRVHLPSNCHVDRSFEHVDNDDGYTMIIPLTFDPSIKTVVWDREFDNRSDLEDWQRSVARGAEPITTTGQPAGVDLRHCVEGNKNFPNYLDHAVCGDWVPGNILIFERQKIHCSSNFRNHLPFKDYVLMHTHDGPYPAKSL